MIEYIVNLNNGNENIGAEDKTINVEETAKTAKQWELVEEINQLNGLLTKPAIEGVPRITKKDSSTGTVDTSTGTVDTSTNNTNTNDGEDGLGG